MLRFSKKADYALLALQYLAMEAPSGIASAPAIAQRYDIPVNLLAKVLQHLARFGFVAAHKGSRGGYHLARPTTAISVAEVVPAIDGPFAVTACAPGDERCAQSLRAPCAIRCGVSRRIEFSRYCRRRRSPRWLTLHRARCSWSKGDD